MVLEMVIRRNNIPVETFRNSTCEVKMINDNILPIKPRPYLNRTIKLWIAISEQTYVRQAAMISNQINTIKGEVIFNNEVAVVAVVFNLFGNVVIISVDKLVAITNLHFE